MKKIILCAAAFILAVQMHGFAAINLTYNTQNSSIKIDVSKIQNEPALVYVVKGEYNAGDAFDSRNYIFFKELYEDSSVTCTIPSDAESGLYTVVASVEGKTESETIRYMNVSAAEDVIAKLRAADTAGKVKSIINENYSVLGVDYDEFSENADGISEKFLKLFSGTKKEAEDFRNAYYSALAMTLASKTDNEQAEAILKKYSNELGLGFDEYSALSTNVKNEFLRLIKKGEIHKNTPDMQTKEYIFLAKFNTCEAWAECRKMLCEDYADFLGINLTKYNNSKNKEDIIKAVMKKAPFDSADDCSKAFDLAVASTESSGGGSSGGNSSGGGSGSVSSGGYVSTGTESSSASTFEDVPQSHWAFEYIKKLHEKKIISGIDDKHFCPDNGITRAEFATLIANMFYPNEAAKNVELNDVSSDAWYYKPISILYNDSIIYGDETGNINPGSKITREDVCVLISRILKYDDGQQLPFDDSEQISTYAKGAVSALFEKGIISGRGDNMFNPKDGMTRAEVAAVLYKISERS